MWKKSKTQRGSGKWFMTFQQYAHSDYFYCHFPRNAFDCKNFFPNCVCVCVCLCSTMTQWQMTCFAKVTLDFFLLLFKITNSSWTEWKWKYWKWLFKRTKWDFIAVNLNLFNSCLFCYQTNPFVAILWALKLPTLKSW